MLIKVQGILRERYVRPLHEIDRNCSIECNLQSFDANFRPLKYFEQAGFIFKAVFTVKIVKISQVARAARLGSRFHFESAEPGLFASIFRASKCRCRKPDSHASGPLARLNTVVSLKKKKRTF